MMTTQLTPAHIAEARQLGIDAAQAAASWTVDGNTKREFIPAVLEMFDAGDPQAYDYLPARPNLSGEWADAPTPLSLAREILGTDDPSPEDVDALADAWEAGVSDTFESACEAELRRAL